MSGVVAPAEAPLAVAPSRRALARHAPALWLAGACVAVAALHLVLSRAMPAPFLLQDELGYLANARLVAGLETPIQPNSPFYHAGYSLLVAPIYLLGLSPAAVYQGVLVLNALLGAALVLVLYPLARRLLRLTPGPALIAAALGALYPAFLLNGNIAWAENLLVPLVALWVFLGLRAAAGSHRGWAYAAGFAAAGAGLYLVHPRALPLAVLTLVFLGVLGLRRRLAGGAALIAAGVLVLGVVATQALHGWVREAVYAGGTTGTDTLGEGGTAARVLDALTTPADWPEAMLRAAGAVWYLSVSSLGLWTIGVAYLGVLAIRRRGSVQMAAGLVLASVVATLAVSSLYLVEGVRVDWLVYGRYVEAAAAVPVLAGAGALLLIARRAARVAVLVGAGLVGVAAGVAMYAGNGADAFGPEAPGGVQPVTILGILAPAGVEWPDLVSLDVARASLVALVATAALGLLVAASRRAAAAGVAALFVASALVAEPQAIRPLAEGVNAFVTIDEAARALPGDPPIDYDLAAFSAFGATAYSFWLDDSEFRLIDTGAGDLPEQVAITSFTWPGASVGAHLAAFESRQDQALWVMPGPLLDRLRAEGRVFPGPADAPLPPEARSSRLTLEAGGLGPRTLAGNETRPLDLFLAHAGSGSPWRQRGLVPGVQAAAGASAGAVTVIAEWRPGADPGAPPVAVQGAEIPRTLAPGDGAGLELELTAGLPDGRPLPPGSYLVRIGVHQERVGPFAAGGDGSLDLPVTVTG